MGFIQTAEFFAHKFQDDASATAAMKLYDGDWQFVKRMQKVRFKRSDASVRSEMADIEYVSESLIQKGTFGTCVFAAAQTLRRV